MCYYPLAGETMKIYHPTTTNAGLSYLYTALVRRTDYDRPFYIKKKKKRERDLVKTRKTLFAQSKRKFWTRLCEAQVWDKVEVQVVG